MYFPILVPPITPQTISEWNMWLLIFILFMIKLPLSLMGFSRLAPLIYLLMTHGSFIKMGVPGGGSLRHPLQLLNGKAGSMERVGGMGNIGDRIRESRCHVNSPPHARPLLHRNLRFLPNFSPLPRIPHVAAPSTPHPPCCTPNLQRVYLNATLMECSESQSMPVPSRSRKLSHLY